MIVDICHVCNENTEREGGKKVGTGVKKVGGQNLKNLRVENKVFRVEKSQ